MIAALVVFVGIVLACAAAPLYAELIAQTGPNENHITEQVTVDGRPVDVVSRGGTEVVEGEIQLDAGGTPIGPQLWRADGRYALGADTNGRDVAVRILYGGQNSLKIGIGSALIATLIATVAALAAAYLGGMVDWLVIRWFDLVWSFPTILLAIGIGTALAISGFHHFGIDLEPGSLWIPTGIIAFAIIPYLGRPLRAELLAVRQKQFVLAAQAQGAGPLRIMFRELLPNVAFIVVTLLPLVVALNIEFEAALSFIGAGVQPPDASWGTLVADGASRIVSAPWIAIGAGVAIVLTALSLNVIGDAVRQSLDPRVRLDL